MKTKQEILVMKSGLVKCEGYWERTFLIWNIANLVVFLMNLMQKECYLYSILDGKRKSEWCMNIILLKWKVGSGRIKMRNLQHQCHKDFSCLCWNNVGCCWSFLGESPKIHEKFPEENFQQNQNWTLIPYVECTRSNHNCLSVSVSISINLWTPLLSEINTSPLDQGP